MEVSLAMYDLPPFNPHLINPDNPPGVRCFGCGVGVYTGENGWFMALYQGPVVPRFEPETLMNNSFIKRVWHVYCAVSSGFFKLYWPDTLESLCKEEAGFFWRSLRRLYLRSSTKTP